MLATSRPALPSRTAGPLQHGQLVPPVRRVRPCHPKVGGLPCLKAVLGSCTVMLGMVLCAGPPPAALGCRPAVDGQSSAAPFVCDALSVCVHQLMLPFPPPPTPPPAMTMCWPLTPPTGARCSTRRWCRCARGPRQLHSLLPSLQHLPTLLCCEGLPRPASLSTLPALAYDILLACINSTG